MYTLEDIEAERESVRGQLASDLPKWLADVAFAAGRISQRYDESTNNHTPVDILLSYEFIGGTFNATTRIKIKDEGFAGCESIGLHAYNDWNRLYIHGRNSGLTDADRTDVVSGVNDIFLKMFGRYGKIILNFCKCDMPIHFDPATLDQYERDTDSSIYIDPRHGFCEWRFNKWVCRRCIEYYEQELPRQLQRAEIQESESNQSERAKMTKALRWEVLARDEFTCKACGRSPLKGDRIKMHVDHIKPIAKGGKTVKPNLHTLCEECNLGKSDRELVQHDLFSITE